MCTGTISTFPAECVSTASEVLPSSQRDRASVGVRPSTIIYAWILQHPVGALLLVGSCKPERLEEALEALDLRMEREDWYRIYASSGQQMIR